MSHWFKNFRFRFRPGLGDKITSNKTRQKIFFTISTNFSHFIFILASGNLCDRFVVHLNIVENG